MALQLKRAGVKRVRPLEGGYEEWLRLGYPVEAVDAEGAHSPVAAEGRR